jgi:D-alanine--D-alanine ligase
LVWTEDEEIGFGPPYVVKPNAQGSTVGVSFVREAAGLQVATRKALRYGSGALVEEWIEGMEISVPVLCGQALPAVEIVPKAGVYDFAAKYELGATEEVVPARLPETVYRKSQELAERAHRILGCEGATRTDFMVRDGELYLLELNTIPGLTQTSLLPNSANSAGISFEELCDRMVQDALVRNAAKT